MNKPYKTVQCRECGEREPMCISWRQHYNRQFSQLEHINGSYTVSVDEVYNLCCGYLDVSLCQEDNLEYKGEKPSGLYKDEKNVERYANVGTWQASRTSLLEQLRNMAMSRKELGLNSVSAYSRMSLEKLN